MTGSDALGKQGHDRLSPIAERRGATVLSVRGLRLRPDGAPIDLEFKAGELIGLAGLEGHGGNTFLEALRGGIQTEGEVVRHLADGREAVIRTPVRRRRSRDRLRAARAPSRLRVQLDVDPRELRARDARPRHPLRLAATARLAQAPAGLRRPPRDRARLARALDHDAVGRQPAEGDHRPLARVRPERAAAERPDPRHRHRGEERPVRAVRRARERGPHGRHALDRARRARRADGPRPRLPRAGAVQGVRPRARSRARASSPPSSGRTADV